ncbi:MAG: hypothetical protein ACUVUB_08450 [Candidatus Bathyarchaeia archaeon]
MYIVDGKTVRKSTFKGCCDWARLADAVENMDSTAEIHSTDATLELSDRYDFKAMAMNTTALHR